MADDKKFPNVLNMSALGDRLREAREKKGFSINQAQRETHIQANILKALEDGSCDSIMNPTYAKSFLKKYSDYLGIDSGALLNEYKRLHPKTETVIINKTPGREGVSSGISSMIPFVRLVVVGVIAIALMVFIGGKVLSNLKKPKVPASAAAAKVKAPAAVKTKSAKKAPAPKKDMDAAIPKNVQLKLLLKVNKNVLVKIRVDGALISEHVMTKGTAEVFTADNVINIYTANGDSIELMLNGKSMGSPGKGLLKNIEITRSGIKIK